MESGLKLLPCPWCDGGELSFVRLSTVHGAVCCEDCGARGPSAFYRGDGDGERAPVAQGAWNTRAPSDAALVEALEPFARAYERWADGGNLKGWQAERMKQSVDAHRYRVAFEALAAAKGQQP